MLKRMIFLQQLRPLTNPFEVEKPDNFRYQAFHPSVAKAGEISNFLKEDLELILDLR